MDIVDLTSHGSARPTDTRWDMWEQWKRRKVKVDPFMGTTPMIVESSPQMIISDPSKVNRIPPESVALKVRSQLYMKSNCVAIWHNYGIFNWDGINEIVKLHKMRECFNKVSEEYSWLRSQTDPKTQIDGVNTFMNSIWHSPLTSVDEQSLAAKRLLTDGLIEHVLNMFNETQTTDTFLILNHLSVQNLEKLYNPSIKKLHFVINVCKQNSKVYVSPNDSNGSHWTYLCIPTDQDDLIYGDSLGWDMPVDLFQNVKPVLAFLKSKGGMPFASTRPRMLHVPTRGVSHKCSVDCHGGAPKQDCWSVCGVSVLCLCAAALDTAFWRLITVEKKVSQETQYIRNITRYSDKLRLIIMSWIGNKKVSVEDLIYRPPSMNRTRVLNDITNSSHQDKTEHDHVPQETEMSNHVPKKRMLCPTPKKRHLLSGNSPVHIQPSSAIDHVVPVETEMSNHVPKKRMSCPTPKKRQLLCADSASTFTNTPTKLPGNSPVHFQPSSAISEISKTTCTIPKVNQTHVLNYITNSSHQKKTEHDHVVPVETEMSNHVPKKRMPCPTPKKRHLLCADSPSTSTNTPTKLPGNSPVHIQPSSAVSDTIPKVNWNLSHQNTYVMSENVTFQGLSRKFYKNQGISSQKNNLRHQQRSKRPLIEEGDVPIAVKRARQLNQTLDEGINGLSLIIETATEAKKSHLMKIQKTAIYIRDNGPLVKTQDVCMYYRKLDTSNTRRMHSNEMVEKIGQHVNILQIYISNTGYLLDGKHNNAHQIVGNVGEILAQACKTVLTQTMEHKLKDIYKSSLESIDTTYDKNIIKGMLAKITSVKFMSKLEGKKNKATYRHCRDVLSYNIASYKEIQKVNQIVRNDMTNVAQRALTKRRVKKQKLLHLKAIYEGRGRNLKCNQYKDLAAVLEFCFGELDVTTMAGGGLESHPRLTDAILYRAVDNNTIMRRARDVILALAPEGFKISLSSCYNYTENYKSRTHQAKQHHAGRNVNAHISLHDPPRTGVQQFVVNLHWTTANVCLHMDDADQNKSSTVVDSKDAKAIVCANVAPVQKPGKTWKKIELLDHDWDQSRTFAITPMTHLFLETKKEDQSELIGKDSVVRVTRTGEAVTLLNMSFFEPDTAFRSMNELLGLMGDPRFDTAFRNSETGKLKDKFLFIVDNGPSQAPSNKIVQMCLARLCNFLNIKKVTQVSYAEYHSKRNPVERVHAEENYQLSSHGPFSIDTKHVEPGSESHRQLMEEMSDNVRKCLETGNFGGKPLSCLRGLHEDEFIFQDEAELKNFLSMSDGNKDICEHTYKSEKNALLETLTMTWGVNPDFEGTYIHDFEIITNSAQCYRTSWKDKYSTTVYNSSGITNEQERQFEYQPLPDYIKYLHTGELHYLPLDKTMRLSEHDTGAWDVEAIFLPSRILDLFVKVLPDPPNSLLHLIALASWVTEKEVEIFYAERADERKKTLEQDIENDCWKDSVLFKKKKNELKDMCRAKGQSDIGNKIDLVKRLNEEQTNNVIVDNYMYNGNLSDVPKSISAISNLRLPFIRKVLNFHNVNIDGKKEELVLRLFMLIHKENLIFRKEYEGVKNYIQILEHLIQIEKEDHILHSKSTKYIRKFDGSNRPTRDIPGMIHRRKPVVPVPGGTDFDNINHIFAPLKDYLHSIFHRSVSRDSEKNGSRLDELAKPGKLLRVKWLREEVKSTGWRPGWYTAKVSEYDKEMDTIELEYLREEGQVYKMNFTKSITDGLIEPCPEDLARWELYDTITTVGTILEIKWLADELGSSGWNEGWYAATVVEVDEPNDKITVCYDMEPDCTYETEVMPLIERQLMRLIKQTK